MSDKIKPCPWCHQAQTQTVRRKMIQVWCPACGAEGPDSATREAAIAAWNEVAGLRSEVARLKADLATREPKP